MNITLGILMFIMFLNIINLINEIYEGKSNQDPCNPKLVPKVYKWADVCSRWDKIRGNPFKLFIILCLPWKTVCKPKDKGNDFTVYQFKEYKNRTYFIDRRRIKNTSYLLKN